MTRKITNNILAIPAALAAIPAKPRTPATSAIIRKSRPAHVRVKIAWLRGVGFEHHGNSLDVAAVRIVALFSARIAQHMLLLLVAAPLIAMALPDARAPSRLWSACSAFFVALWFSHMARPHDATFASTTLYWAMHLTLFGSAIWLWREVLQTRHLHSLEVLAPQGTSEWPMSYDIAVGMRPDEEQLRERLDAALLREKTSIDELLREYHIPRVQPAAQSANT